ncbi:MAG: hypothetical protein V4508_15290 [Pseudomonadota bacterium]
MEIIAQRSGERHPGVSPAPGLACKVAARVAAGRVGFGIGGRPDGFPVPRFRNMLHGFTGAKCVLATRLDVECDPATATEGSDAWFAASASGIACAELELGAVAQASADADLVLLLDDAGQRLVGEFAKWQFGGGAAPGAVGARRLTYDLPPSVARAFDPRGAGLPMRVPVLVTRERQAFATMVAQLLTITGAGCATPGGISCVLLERGFASPKSHGQYLAAFLAGRHDSGNCAAEREIDLRLAQAATWSRHPDVAIEAAMSLVLRGKQEPGIQALQLLLASERPHGDQYKAAFYLAQLGDPSGYGALVNAMHSSISHYRLMAVRHALAFSPYQGQVVEGIRVDLRSLLAERIGDPDPLVRAELAYFMNEMDVPRQMSRA